MPFQYKVSEDKKVRVIIETVRQTTHLQLPTR